MENEANISNLGSGLNASSEDDGGALTELAIGHILLRYVGALALGVGFLESLAEHLVCEQTSSVSGSEGSLEVFHGSQL